MNFTGSSNCQQQFFYTSTRLPRYTKGNTFLGTNALSGNGGRENSAFGAQALGGSSGNNQGNYNTAIGRGALQNNVRGDRNTAVGFDALSNNLEGKLNTAVGDYSLVQMTRGLENTAVGREALANLGKPANENNTIIDDKLYSAGRRNTALGHQAGVNLGSINSTIENTNNNNTFLGANTDVFGAGGGYSPDPLGPFPTNFIPYQNSTAVGAGSKITKSDQMVLGVPNSDSSSGTEVYIPGQLAFGTSNFSSDGSSLYIYQYNPSSQSCTKYEISISEVTE